MCRVIKGKKLSVKDNMGFVFENQLQTQIVHIHLALYLYGRDYFKMKLHVSKTRNKTELNNKQKNNFRVSKSVTLG